MLIQDARGKSGRRKIRRLEPRSGVLTALLLALMTLGLARIQAQVATADIVGTVTDSTGAILPNVPVTAENLGTHEIRTAQTTSSGDFTFTLLNPGMYRVMVKAPGFKTFSVPALSLAAGDRSRVDAALKIGQSSETVEVTSSVPLLQSQSSALTHTLTEKSVQDLPLNGRNFINLAQIAPGANEGPPNGLSSGGRPDDRRQTSSVSVNGQSEAINDELIDGMDNNERIIGTIGARPSVESIQEVSVQTNTYTAEVGRTAGGIVNVITKSGNNDFHGSLYEFFRNDKLDAYPFAFGAAIPKPKLRQNQFGGSLGGPIVRNRTFFFFDYENFRLVQGSSPEQLTVPTLYEEQHPGDFTDVGGTKISAANIDPVGLAYFKLYPAPNSGMNQFVGSTSKTQFTDTYDARVDHHFNDRNLFFARYTYNNVASNLTSPFPTVTENSLSISPGGGPLNDLLNGPAKDIAHQGQLNYVHILTPNLVVELKAGYTRISNASFPQNYGKNVNAAFGQPNINLGQSTSGLAPIFMLQAANLGNGGLFLPLQDIDNTFQYMGAITWTKGQHSIKIGGGLIRRQATNIQDNFGEGLWIVLGLPDLVQGNYLVAERNNSLDPPHYRTWEPSGYIQDDWRVTQKLTLNMGLRYDVFTPFTEAHDHIANFDPNTASILVAGQSGVSRTAGIQTYYGNLAPRFGFAYTVLPQTVLRGGFGMSYFPSNYTSTASLKNQPFISTFGPVPQFLAPAAYQKLSGGLPLPTPSSATNPSGSIPANVALNFRSSYLEQFNLTAERAFGSNVLTVSYVGMLGRHLGEQGIDMNSAPPNTCGAPGNPCANYNTLRPFYKALPNVSTIPTVLSFGSSSYHALQASFARRYLNGLAFGANYTLAHGLDDVTGISTGGGGQNGFGAVPSKISKLEYGNSDLDLRNRYAMTANWELPFGKNLKGIAGQLGKGWQMNLLQVWSSGLPFSVSNATNVAGNEPGTQNSDRPNQVGSAHVSNAPLAEFFNPAAFVAQTAGTIGSTRRNSLYGPHFRHLDLSLFKTFNFYRETALQFRAEGFNITNTSNFAAPNSSLGGAAFGAITSLSNNYQPRLIQLALKLQF